MTEEEAEPGLPRVTLALAVAVGIGLRVLLLTTSLGRPDADEVIGGLMARHLTSDPYPLWFWGQHYGGTPEIVPVALSLRLFGGSVTAMRVPTILMGAGCAVLLWRVARRVVPERVAQTAGLLTWIWSPPAVWLTVREMMFYVPTVFAGLVLGLFAFRVRERRGWWNWLPIVVAFALGAWMIPAFSYFIPPAAVVLFGARATRIARWVRDGVRARDGVRIGTSLIAAGTVVILVVLVVDKVVTIARRTPELEEALRIDQYWPRVRWFFTDGLPGLLGYREMFTYRWIGGGVGVAAYLATSAVILVGLVLAARRRAWDAVGLACFPLIFGFIPRATDQPNMRYLYYALPFVALAITRVASLRRWGLHALLVVAVGVTGIGFQRIHVVSEVDKTVRVGNVGDLDEAIEVLDAAHVDAVFANYWIAFRITFESEERIIAAAPFDEQRYPPYLDTVRASDHPAWVVEDGHQRQDLATSLRDIGVGYREVPAGEFWVVFPDRLVNPDELGRPARGGI